MKKHLVFAFSLLLTAHGALAANVGSEPRAAMSLNGAWNFVVDQYDTTRGLPKGDRPWGKNDREEYSIDDAETLLVPGDWNHQREDLKYYEGTIWYARHFDLTPDAAHRYIIRFDGVSYKADVYVNGKKAVGHEGSFTRFQADITDLVKAGDNYLAVRVNNRREKDRIPAMSFDWFNYGGITRDVTLLILPSRYVKDYFIQLDKHRSDVIHATVNLSDSVAGETVRLNIPELKKNITLKTDPTGKAQTDIAVPRLTRWSPANPKLYKVEISTATDKVADEIGFRNIEVKGTQVLLNGNPVFLKGISIHEEIAMQQRRACTKEDADLLLDEAQALGVNMIRLAHYQQSEYMVRGAERRGIMLWQEIPVWQAIDFGNPATQEKAVNMLKETIQRDKNRCADCFWGIANETRNTPERNRFLARLLQTGKDIDTTRLFVAAFDLAYFDRKADKFMMHDDFYQNLDLVGINKYMGWYEGWHKQPKDLQWDVCSDKPLFISEFGGEAKYGIRGNEDVAGSWSEDFQARLYRMNLEMFKNIKNLVGICPWILFDFRSPTRLHQSLQNGFNRKGLVGDKGERKQAWYVVRDFYDSWGDKIVNPISKGIDKGGLRDCYVFRADGRWYLTGTTAPHWGDGYDNPGVRLYRSDNLTDWEEVGLIVKNPGTGRWYASRFWAPEIACIGGKYYCTFNCRNERDGYQVKQSWGIAVADQVEGPYKVLTDKKPVSAGNDATLFEDEDGRVYAAWCGPSKEHPKDNVMLLAEIDIKTLKLKNVHEIFKGTPGDLNKEGWDGCGVEGPAIFKRGDTYYMTYSSWQRGYEVGVVTTTDINGTWTKAADNPVFGAQNKSRWKDATETEWTDLGHNTVFTGPDGMLWMSCHGQKRDSGLPPMPVLHPLKFDAQGQLQHFTP